MSVITEVAVWVVLATQCAIVARRRSDYGLLTRREYFQFSHMQAWSPGGIVLRALPGLGLRILGAVIMSLYAAALYLSEHPAWYLGVPAAALAWFCLVRSVADLTAAIGRPNGKLPRQDCFDFLVGKAAALSGIAFMIVILALRG